MSAYNFCQGSTHFLSSSDTPTSKRKTKATKVQRKWGDEAPTETDMASLDFSSDPTANDSGRGAHDVQALVDQTSLGTRTKDGLYEVKDWEFSSKADDVIANALKPAENASAKSTVASGSLGALGSLFARLTGSKVLTEQDLKPVLDGMKQHLMKKNVAMEIADKVCEGVGESLVGKKVGGFQSKFLSVPIVLFLTCSFFVLPATNAAVRLALSTSLTRILTPKTSTDLLLSIRTKLSSPLPSTQQRMPYSITFVGVNGVGKSTNLSKVCFWLIQNGLRVLIAACDTFRYVFPWDLQNAQLDLALFVRRSGAVEQLRVHVRNLSTLGVNGAADSKGRVELFERGYGKDAAGIAREAIAYGNSDIPPRTRTGELIRIYRVAKDNDFDVVLIDTAGRMQDNEVRRPSPRIFRQLILVYSFITATYASSGQSTLHISPFFTFLLSLKDSSSLLCSW